MLGFKYRPVVSVVVAALSLAALSLAGCAGHEDSDLDDDLEISETDSTTEALTSPEPGDGDAERAECRDGDDHKRKHHLRHKFRILDRLDGARDKQITIASLPTGLPERLIAKLHSLDTDGDGDMTRDELKAALRARKHGGHGGRGGRDK